MTRTCTRCGERDERGEHIRPEDPSTDWWCRACLVELVGRVVAVLARAGGASTVAMVDERWAS